MFTLVNELIALTLFVIAVYLGKAGFEYFLGQPVLYLLATTIPGFAKLVRRLHDTNHSGWWMFISVVPFIGGLILSIFWSRMATGERTVSAPTPRRYRQRATRPRWVTWLLRSPEPGGMDSIHDHLC